MKKFVHGWNYSEFGFYSAHSTNRKII